MAQTTADQDARTFLEQLELEHTSPPRRSRRRSRRDNFFADWGGGARAALPGGYQGGRVDRMTEDWQPGHHGPNRLFQMDGKLLRERAWDLYNNNPHASSAINAYAANVIECGIIPQRDGNWTNAWNRWGGLTGHATRECDITRDQTIYELMTHWLIEILVGGGCLVHYVDRPRRDQRIPMAIELIPEERFADHVLYHGTNPKTRNPVRNGIETDSVTGRTVAYHVTQGDTHDMADGDAFAVQRLLAQHCEYGTIKYKDRIGAKRGTTLLRPAVLFLFSLGYYLDNELKNSDVRSAWAYMIKTDSDVDFDWDDLLDSDPETGATDVYGNKIEKVEGQQIWRGAPGDEITAVGPNTPPGDALPWILLIQRSIAIGVGQSYEETFRDYSQGNFASIKMGHNADKKRYRPLQNFTVNHFGNPTVCRFDDAAVGALTPGFPTPAEYLDTRDETLDAMAEDWQPPGWESANPKDDAIAENLRLKNSSTTLKDSYGCRGKSWKRALKQRGKEIKAIKKYKLPDPATTRAPSNAAGAAR